MLDFIISTSIIFLGFIFINLNKKYLNKNDLSILKKIWVYHLLFTFLFYFYTQNNSADANGYWRVAKNSSELEFLFFLIQGQGTPFMYVLNYFPAKILDLTIFTGMMFYGFLGFLGFYFFYRITVFLVPFNSSFSGVKLFPFLFFLPNMHFWSAGVGKDTLMFFSVGMFCYAMLKINKRFFLIILSSLIMFMVRPHVYILILLAFGISYFFSKEVEKGKKSNKLKKILFMGLLIGLAFFILPIVLKYVNLEENSSINDVIDRTKAQAENLSGKSVGSSIDISSYPYPLKIMSFLFRPLFFDYNGLFSLFASFENLLLLLLTIKILKNNFIKSIRKAPLVIKGLVFFLFFGTLMFSFTLGNLGIILRMKNMFIPGFLIFILWNLSYKKVKPYEKVVWKKELL